MAELVRRADAASVRVIDGVVVFWVVFWLAVGGWVGISLWELATLGDTLVASGRTLDSAGRALQRLSDLPLVGEQPGRLGDEVRANAAEIVAQGRESAAHGRRLSVLLGVAVAFAPLLPVLLPFLPARLARRREVRSIGRALRDPDGARWVDHYLAHRAISVLPLDGLRQVSDDPWRDLSEGRVRPLADAELRRLGLARAAATYARR